MRGTTGTVKIPLISRSSWTTTRVGGSGSSFTPPLGTGFWWANRLSWELPFWFCIFTSCCSDASAFWMSGFSWRPSEVLLVTACSRNSLAKTVCAAMDELPSNAWSTSSSDCTSWSYAVLESATLGAV